MNTTSEFRRALLVLAAGFLAVGAAACTGPRPPGSTTTTTVPPRPGACHDIDFIEASVATQGSGESARYVLTVSGNVGNTREVVSLQPVTYVRQPEYWQIQVVACLRGDVGAPVVTPFKVSLDITNTLGTEGIVVTGATRRQQIDVPAKPAPPLAGSGWVLVPSSLGVPVPAGRLVTLSFSAANLGGNTSCNSYGAPYTATGTAASGALTLGPIHQTLIGCPPDIAAVETAYLRKLGAVSAYRVNEGGLTLIGSQGNLEFATPPPGPYA